MAAGVPALDQVGDAKLVVDCRTKPGSVPDGHEIIAFVPEAVMPSVGGVPAATVSVATALVTEPELSVTTTE